jgi:hypothetical protein
VLGINKALEQFKAYPDDPYVIIPQTNIELRFGEGGTILAAYNADVKPAIRWASEDFRKLLSANRS